MWDVLLCWLARWLLEPQARSYSNTGLTGGRWVVAVRGGGEDNINTAIIRRSGQSEHSLAPQSVAILPALQSHNYTLIVSLLPRFQLDVMTMEKYKNKDIFSYNINIISHHGNIKDILDLRFPLFALFIQMFLQWVDVSASQTEVEPEGNQDKIS